MQGNNLNIGSNYLNTCFICNKIFEPGDIIVEIVANKIGFVLVIRKVHLDCVKENIDADSGP